MYYYPWLICTHTTPSQFFCGACSPEMLLGAAMGDQHTVGFFVLLGSHLRLSEPEHISGTDLAR